MGGPLSQGTMETPDLMLIDLLLGCGEWHPSHMSPTHFILHSERSVVG